MAADRLSFRRAKAHVGSRFPPVGSGRRVCQSDARGGHSAHLARGHSALTEPPRGTRVRAHRAGGRVKGVMGGPRPLRGRGTGWRWPGRPHRGARGRKPPRAGDIAPDGTPGLLGSTPPRRGRPGRWGTEQPMVSRRGTPRKPDADADPAEPSSHCPRAMWGRVPPYALTAHSKNLARRLTNAMNSNDRSGARSGAQSDGNSRQLFDGGGPRLPRAPVTMGLAQFL